MRTKLSVLAAAVALVFAGAAKADTVSIIWQTSGTATTAVAAGSSTTIIADIVLTLTNSNIDRVNVTIEWDNDSANELNHTGSATASGLAAGYVNSGLLTVLNEGASGERASFGLTGDSGNAMPTGSEEMGTITFHVNGAITDGIDVIASFANTSAGDGCIRTTSPLVCDGAVSFAGARVDVVPEPTTVGLVALGLAGLGLVGRRSRR